MKHAAGCLVLALFLATSAGAQFKRIPASEFQKNPARVAALKRAVTRMKQLNSSARMTAKFRQSWDYWANTHGYLGLGPNACCTAKEFKASAPTANGCGALTGPEFNLCVSYYNHSKDSILPKDGITIDVWGMCQHSDPSGTAATANMQFFTWHRMYLKYFERTLRKYSGDPNFTLPYWDYFDESGPGGGIALPTMMRGTAGANTLVDTFRTPGLNKNVSAIAPSTGYNNQAFDFTDFRDFSFSLEVQPHGVMHCGTGWGCQAPDIGIVPVAGLDPVFYMHHANIDRLFQCWLEWKANGQPITLAWAKANLGMTQDWFDQTWHFVDENGAAVSMTVSDLFQPGGIDYVYQQTKNCVQGPPPPAAPALEAVPAPPRELKTMTSPGAVSLRGKSTAVPLAPNTLEGPEPQMPERVHVRAGRTVLLIENVRLEGGHPGLTYEIFLARKSDPARRVYIATFSWFGVLGRAHAGHGASAQPPGHRLLYYDVTDELAQLGNPDESDIAVTFEPSGGTTDAAPALSSRAGTVTVGSIRLQRVQ